MFLVLNRKICVISLATVISALLVTFGGVLVVSNSGEKKIPIYSVERADNNISLTFNCAWGDEDIPQILEVLNKYNIKSTFFVVGTWAEKYPESLKKISESGHEIGGHSYNHGHYQNMSYDEILKDLDSCDSAVERVISTDISLVRGGFGEYNNDVIDACGSTNRTYIQWSVDSLDYKAKSAEEIKNRVLEKVKSGDIILMHTGTEFTAAALDSLLVELTKDFKPVTVSDLIYTESFIIDVTGKQKSTA